MLTSAYVLNRAAAAAAKAPQPVPRPGQYILVTSVAITMTQANPGSPAARSWLTVDNYRVWWSADGRKQGLSQDTLLRNQRLPWGGPAPKASRQVYWSPVPAQDCPGALGPRFTYDYLATLPTSTMGLRTWIYRHKDGGQSANDQAGPTSAIC